MGRLGDLQRIRDEVSARFEYRSDEETRGVLEHWIDKHELAGMEVGEPLVGDCDDFALACRYRCREEGIETRLVYCLTETGEGHLVLADAEYGFIVDNRNQWVVPRDQVNYTWLSASGLNQGDPWQAVL